MFVLRLSCDPREKHRHRPASHEAGREKPLAPRVTLQEYLLFFCGDELNVDVSYNLHICISYKLINMLYDRKIFGTSSEIFGNRRKSSTIIENLRNLS